MAANLACVGLGVASQDELAALVDSILATAVPLGRAGDTDVLRWQDDSGARLVVTFRNDELEQLLPSFAGTPGARLTGVHALNDELSHADVVDESGEQLTALALELEQRALLRGRTVSGRASIVALGSDVSVHADEAAFQASPASILGSPDEHAAEPPPMYAERGWPWPPRMAAESFISYGVFGEPAEAQAYARLNGVVRSAQRRTNGLTGQAFIVARVSTAGFQADVCLAASEHPDVPAAGSVIGGTVFMVGSLEAWTDVPRNAELATGWHARLTRALGRRHD